MSGTEIIITFAFACLGTIFVLVISWAYSAHQEQRQYDNAMKVINELKPTREQLLEKEVARLQKENANLAVRANKTEYR